MLVSPDVDLLSAEITLDHLNWLIQVCGSAPQFRFLLWSASPELFTQVLDWPENIEVALNVSTEAELALFGHFAAQIKPLTAIWITPREPLQFSGTMPFTRCLIGTSMEESDPDGQLLNACAFIIGIVVLELPRPTIHIAAHILGRLAHSSNNAPADGVSKEEERSILPNEANYVPEVEKGQGDNSLDMDGMLRDKETAERIPKPTPTVTWRTKE